MKRFLHQTWSVVDFLNCAFAHIRYLQEPQVRSRSVLFELEDVKYILQGRKWLSEQERLQQQGACFKNCKQIQFKYVRSHGVMVSTLDFDSSDPSSNLGGTYRWSFLLNSTTFCVLYENQSKWRIIKKIFSRIGSRVYIRWEKVENSDK